MMPVLVVALVFGSVVLVVKMVLDYNRQKLLSGSGTEDNSLGTGELKRIIREAVDESLYPIVSRLEATENRLDEADQLLLESGTGTVDTETS